MKYKTTMHWLVKLIIIVAATIVLAWIFSYAYDHTPEPKIVSPVAEAKGSNVKVVFAKVKTPEMQVVKMIVDEFEEFGPMVVRQAINIAYCESRFNEEAVHVNKNGSIDRGVYQINSIHKYSEYQLLAAYENIKIAKQMYLRNGKSWSAWACSYK